MPCASPLMDGPPMDICMAAGVKYRWSRRVHVGNPYRFQPTTRPSVATPARGTDPIRTGAVFYPSRDGSRVVHNLVYVGTMVPWAAGQRQKTRGGIGGSGSLFRNEGSFTQNSASAKPWGTDSRLV